MDIAVQAALEAADGRFDGLGIDLDTFWAFVAARDGFFLALRDEEATAWVAWVVADGAMTVECLYLPDTEEDAHLRPEDHLDWDVWVVDLAA